MRYNYSYLENAAKIRSRVGTYLGMGVFAGSKLELPIFASETFYVLYDYHNIMVLNGKVFGMLDEDGSVRKLDQEDILLYQKSLDDIYFKSKVKTKVEEPKSKNKTEFDIDLSGLLDEIAAETEKILYEACKFEYDGRG